MTLEQLIAAIRQRKSVEPFNRGIITADRYVNTIRDVIGMERCYRYMSKGQISFDDLLRKAANTLVYSNDEMELEEIYTKESNGNISKLDLPKNTLMVFRHCLTSSKKDRDGDVLHSEGAIVDPKMLLLWQHVHTLPIGKMIQVANQNSKKLDIISCIVDMNDLSHDAAVMIDNKMGRFSHGFRALKFRENKEGVSGVEDGNGFDITSFEVMEESLVSVPANTDADTEEILLSLVEGGKLTSPIMKEYGKGIRSHRNVSVSGIEIKYTERNNGKERELVCSSFDQLKAAADAGLIGEHEDENQPGSRGKETGGIGKEGQPIGTSKEADENADEESEDSSDTEVNGKSSQSTVVVKADEEAKCPKCGYEGEIPKDGKCPKCDEALPTGKSINTTEKTGRTLSKVNENLIQKAKDHVDDVNTNASDKLTRGHGAQLREASGHLGIVLKSIRQEQVSEGGGKPTMFTIETASAHIIAFATDEQRKNLMKILSTMEGVSDREKIVDQYENIVKGKKPPETPEGDDDGDGDNDNGPSQYNGDLHNDTHHGREVVPAKEAHAFLVKCGLKCTGTSGNMVKCSDTQKQVRALMTKAGFQHRYFTEEQDKAVDAFHLGKKSVEYHGLKATAIYSVKEKGVGAVMLSCKSSD